MRQPTPARPEFFFGRSDIVREVVQGLLLPQHVALTGPGGIGKTYIAKAVINDEEIVEIFGAERYFVAFDNHGTADHHDSAITLDVFADHIANALGLHPTKADKQKIITTYLSDASRRVFLLLDNAETFLHAGKETGRISSMVEDLGALPSVVLMLTTRSLALPPNLHCKYVSVPPLDLGAAREAFKAIYNTPVDTKTVDYLLTELDCHPLSINLLAQAARQNQWSENDITDAWKREKTHVLTTHISSEGAAGKNQSLAVSINLSINSPAFKGIGAEVRDFLRILAFLPEGADVRRLEELVPTASKPHSVVGALCSLSLTYRKGDFVTMLAPIRMYMLSEDIEKMAPLSQSQLLKDIRLYYGQRLRASDTAQEDPRKPRPTKVDGAWILSEDVNVERLLAHDMDDTANADTKQKEAVTRLCVIFMDLLLRFKPRITVLDEKIRSIPSQRPRRLLFYTFPTITNSLLFARAWGFFLLGELAGQVVGEFKKALDMYKKSFEAFEALNARFGMLRCLGQQGSVCQLLGDFVHAEKYLADALKLARSARDPIQQGRLNMELAMLSVFMGRPNAAQLAETGRKLLESMPKTEDADSYLARMHPHITQGYIAYFSNDNASAKHHFQETLNIHEQMPNNGQAYGGNAGSEVMIGLSGVMLREGNIDEAVKMLDKSRTASLQSPLGTVGAASSLGVRASVAAEQGDFEAARAQVEQALVFALSTGEGNFGQAVTIYLRGRIELIAGDLAKATADFHRAIDIFDALSDIRFKSRSYRALGEIALREEKLKDAERLFGKAKAICDEMGIRPEFLYVCLDTFALPKEFTGWESFLNGQLRSA